MIDLPDRRLVIRTASEHLLITPSAVNDNEEETARTSLACCIGLLGREIGLLGCSFYLGGEMEGYV